LFPRQFPQEFIQDETAKKKLKKNFFYRSRQFSQFFSLETVKFTTGRKQHILSESSCSLREQQSMDKGAKMFYCPGELFIIKKNY
jgi:hypothetical protein